MSNSPIIWRPTNDYLKSRVTQFAERNNIDAEDWRALINRSTTDIEWFWNDFLAFADMQWSKPYHTLLDRSKGIAWTDWFIGGQTNIAYNCLDWHIEPHNSLAKNSSRAKAGSEHLALIWENESGASEHWTYGQLNVEAGKIAALLNKLGVKPGDAVGIYMPMIPEVLAILFGCFKMGVIAVPVFSGFGSEALAKRMQDAQSKIIFTADGGKRRGKLLEIKKDVDRIRNAIPTLKHVVVAQYCKNKVDWFEDRACNFNQCSHDNPSDLWLHQALDNTTIATSYELPSDHPCLYLYTSGTTGRPKGTIHTHAGAMSQIAKELGMVFDVQKTDRFFWLTDIGWMMGPWEMIGVTYWGGTLVMYDGAPNYPNPDKLWDLVARLKINTLGISPTAIRILRAESEKSISSYDFSSIKYLGSTGEPWDEDNYKWFFHKIGSAKCPIMNISGGTELIGCLLTPLPTMPLPACSLGSKALAMDVDVYDEAGNGLKNTIGNLVLKQPAPSLTRGFLGDKQRYLDTYFSRFDNTWYHGDWAMQDTNDYWFLYGRSDDTIKISGKRIGPGEIESALIEHEAIKEAAAIGVPDDLKGEVLVCFIVLNNNAPANIKLKEDIVKSLVTKYGALVRPKEIQFVLSLPKTRSGKIVRGAIKKRYLGEENIDTSSIENPEALQAIPSRHN